MQKNAEQQASASAERALKLEQLANAAAQQGEAAQQLLEKAQAQLFSLESQVWCQEISVSYYMSLGLESRQSVEFVSVTILYAMFGDSCTLPWPLLFFTLSINKLAFGSEKEMYAVVGRPLRWNARKALRTSRFLNKADVKRGEWAGQLEDQRREKAELLAEMSALSASKVSNPIEPEGKCLSAPPRRPCIHLPVLCWVVFKREKKGEKNGSAFSGCAPLGWKAIILLFLLCSLSLYRCNVSAVFCLT